MERVGLGRRTSHRLNRYSFLSYSASLGERWRLPIISRLSSKTTWVAAMLPCCRSTCTPLVWATRALRFHSTWRWSGTLRTAPTPGLRRPAGRGTAG